MIHTDVRLFEYVPDADAFIHLSVKRDVQIGSDEFKEIAKRGRLAAIINGTASGKSRIFGDIDSFESDSVVLTIKVNLTSGANRYEKAFAWLDAEFPSRTITQRDKLIRDFSGGSYEQIIYTITLREFDFLKFRLMFPYSSA